MKLSGTSAEQAIYRFVVKRRNVIDVQLDNIARKLDKENIEMNIWSFINNSG